LLTKSAFLPLSLMDRRDFLHPRHIARSAGEVLGALAELRSPSVSDATATYALVHYARRAMATTFEVLLPFATPHSLEAAEEALDEIDRLEAQLTVYRDNSEVSTLNRRAGLTPVPVEEGLFDLLDLARRLHQETQGAFDVSVGALIKAWGFYRRSGRVPSAEERAEVLFRTGMAYVVLDAETRTVHFRRPGVEINLGSIGKGYALDRAADVLRSHHGISSGLLHGGHSSVYALGSNPGDDRGWRVAICHPWERERRLAVVRLRDRALATSAATFQHLEYNGRKLGHILDPRTGWPAEGVASASVLAPTAALADALATAFFILGFEPARAYCAGHPDVGAVLLPEGKRARPVVLGVPARDIDLDSPRR
jgi:thiamine biosynthesis lipoprotein